MRKKYHITTLDLKSLDNNEFFQLMTDSKDILAAFTKTNGQEAAYANRLPQFTERLTRLEGILHKTKSSKVTQALEEADKDRDDALITLTSLIKAFARDKDAERKAAYEQLKTLLTHYKELTSQSYEKETEGITHLLNQLKTSPYQTAVTRLHLTAHVAALTQAQKHFEAYYQQRLTEQANQAPGQARRVREDLQAIYDFLVDFTAITAYAYPERTAYTDLRDKLNVIRDRYRQLQSKRKKAQKGENNEEKKTATQD